MAAAKSKSSNTSRRYDVVLWGATGFTGRLVAEYLADRYGETDLRWALGGRSRAKLDNLRRELAARWPSTSKLDFVIGDSFDRARLDEIAASTRVVCTTVGPYARYGADLVAACAAAGTDYCDLTGEVHFIRRMIDEHHAEATASGARIVNCCGFDSIPSDLGTFTLQQAAVGRSGKPFEAVSLYVDGASGGFSGGTIASMINAFEEMKDPAVRRMLGNPYSLNPELKDQGPDGRDQMSVRYDRDVGDWTGPFIMAAVNTRVVRRSHALLGFPWGRDFRYKEVMRFKGGPLGLARAAGFAAGLGAFGAALSVPLLRRLLQKTVLPDPGQGPSRQAIEQGFFKITLFGKRDGRIVEPPRVTVRGRRDPGYGATAAMLAESALCLALDRDKLPDRAGILTPSTAMGEALVGRLNTSGVVTIVAA